MKGETICPECGEGFNGYGPDWCRTHTGIDMESCKDCGGIRWCCKASKERVEREKYEAEEKLLQLLQSDDRLTDSALISPNQNGGWQVISEDGKIQVSCPTEDIADRIAAFLNGTAISKNRIFIK